MTHDEHRDKWLADRKKCITATDAAVIMESSPWDSKYSLMAKKLGYVPEKPESERFEIALELEAMVARMFEKRTGRKTMLCEPFTLRYHSEHSWMGATLDALQMKCFVHGVLELKTGESWTADKYCGGVPEQYWWQVQHQMAVTGLSYASIAVLIGVSSFKWMDVERDDEAIKRMVEAEHKFYQDMQEERFPDPDESEHTRLAIAARFKKEKTGASIPLPAEFIDLDDEYVVANAELKEAEKKVKAIKNRIAAYIGNAEQGTLPAAIWSYTTTERKGYTVEPTSFRQLRRHAI